MRKQSVDFLKKLVEAPSPSGYEQPVQKLVREEMTGVCDEVRTDLHGNVIGALNPEGQPRIMLAGHCDEIGFIVTHISDEGYVHFAAIGGVDATIVPGSRLHIHTEKGPVFGVVGRKAIHLMEPDDRKREIKLHELWIDIGAKDKKAASKRVQIGDPATFAAGFEVLNGNLVVARGCDDRVGTFVVVETLKLLKNRKPKAAIFGVSTVQEELGLRGAHTSAFGIDPTVGIAIDVTHASDYPDVDKRRSGEVKLGKGPVLHRGANINPVVAERLFRVAKAKKIPYQLTAEPRATGTDANAIQVSRAGVAAGLVSIPNRYMHTPVEVVSLDDLENSAKLITEFILGVTDRTDFTP